MWRVEDEWKDWLQSEKEEAQRNIDEYKSKTDYAEE